MKKKISIALLAAAVLLSASAYAAENVPVPGLQMPPQLIPYGKVSKDGYFKGIRKPWRISRTRSANGNLWRISPILRFSMLPVSRILKSSL